MPSNQNFYQSSDSLSLNEIKDLDEKYLLNVYNRLPITFRYGSGEFLYDAKGNEYIDFLSGLGVVSLGHAHADILNVLNHQAELLWHSSNLFYNREQALLAQALIKVSFPGKVFVCNSGTEANEGALKLMKAWGEKNKKSKIIAFRNGFHGRSLGSVSITGQSKIRDGFGELIPNIEFIEPNDIDELIAAMDDQTSGLIIEPILGEGGIIPIDKDFIYHARELCDTFGALLTMDEVQTGIGRTGTYFYYQQLDCEPDILTIAKGLGGGFPIGAMVVCEKYASFLSSGMHGSTFGGNHLASSIAHEILRTIEINDILTHVNKISAYLWNNLNKLKDQYPSKIKEIRGKGLMIGLVLDNKIELRPLLGKALEQHLVIGRAGENVLRLLPPLILRKSTVDRAMECLKRLIKEI